MKIYRATTTGNLIRLQDKFLLPDIRNLITSFEVRYLVLMRVTVEGKKSGFLANASTHIPAVLSQIKNNTIRDYTCLIRQKVM